jgi:D-3-phosphoglycerate dehydrogenase
LILTPHSRGGTEEAQRNTGLGVYEALIAQASTAIAANCVNLPEVHPPPLGDGYRVRNIHRDAPGVLSRINGLIAGMGVDIKAQACNTRSGIGYLIMDVEGSLSRDIGGQIESFDTSIRTRRLF